MSFDERFDAHKHRSLGELLVTVEKQAKEINALRIRLQQQKETIESQEKKIEQLEKLVEASIDFPVIFEQLMEAFGRYKTALNRLKKVG